MNHANNHILLTGGTGFFGRSLLRNFLIINKLNIATITVLSRNPDGFLSAYPEFSNQQSIIFRKGNVQVRDSLPWNENFTHILHAATDSTLGYTLTPLEQYQNIVDGTQNILDLAVSTGANRFLLTSSGAIYGPQSAEYDSIPEDLLCGPPLSDFRSAYGHGKRSAEHLCALFAKQHDLDIVIARCFSFIGKDLPVDAHFAVGNFIRDALTATAIVVKSDGQAIRTYLDQTDLAEWLFRLLFYGKSCHAYNVGSDEAISITGLAYLIRDILSPNNPVHILGKSSAGLAPDRYVPDITKARKELGLQVTVPLAQAIRIAGDCLRKNQRTYNTSGL